MTGLEVSISAACTIQRGVNNPLRRTVPARLRVARPARTRYSTEGRADGTSSSNQRAPFDVDRVLLCLLDANPNLSEGMRESLVAAARIAGKRKVILLSAGGGDMSEVSRVPRVPPQSTFHSST